MRLHAFYRLFGAEQNDAPNPSKLFAPIVFSITITAVLGYNFGAAAVCVFVLATALSFFSIDLGWNDEINAGFPVLIAATEFLPISQFGLVYASVVFVNVVCRQATGAREWAIPRDLSVWTVSSGFALLVIYVERHTNVFTFADQPTKASIELLAIPALVALVCYHAATDAFRREPSSWRSRLSADAAMWSFTLAIAAGYRQSGLQLLIGLALVPLVLWYAFRRFGLARVAQEEAVSALALMPEITEFSAYGHGVRSAVYADAVCRAYRFAPETREKVVHAIQVFRLGFLTYPSPDEFDDSTAVPTKNDLASSTTQVLKESRFLSGVTDLTTQVIVGEKLDREGAIVTVVSDFDDFVGHEIDFAQIALDRLRERYPNGHEAEVVEKLSDVIKHDLTLLERARSAGEPIIFAAMRAEEEIALDDH